MIWQESIAKLKKVKRNVSAQAAHQRECLKQNLSLEGWLLITIVALPIVIDIIGVNLHKLFEADHDLTWDIYLGCQQISFFAYILLIAILLWVKYKNIIFSAAYFTWAGIALEKIIEFFWFDRTWQIKEPFMLIILILAFVYKIRKKRGRQKDEPQPKAP